MRLPVQDDVLCASAVVAAMVGVALLAKTTRSDRAVAPQMARAAKDLMQQSLQWLDMCDSHQDTAYKLQTATLATAYCNAARVVAPDEEIARQLNVDVHEKLRAMETLQRKVLLRLQRDGASDAPTVSKAEGTAIGSSINWL